MARSLIMVSGKYKDETTGEAFAGVVPRDLEIGDSFTFIGMRGVKKLLIVNKELNEDQIIIETKEV